MPFGRPVDPEEYIQNAMSSRCVSAGAICDSGPREPFGCAACVGTGPGAAASPLTTTSVRSRVPSQATALKRSTKAASQMATVAPESAR